MQHELQRRIRKLEDKRDEHLQRAGEIEDELRSLHVIVDVGRTAKKKTRRSSPKAERQATSADKRSAWETRKANKQPLVEILDSVINGTTMTTRELADAALQAGYVTQSKNFANSVGVTLYKDDRFSKKDGKWWLAADHLKSSEPAR